MMNEENVSSVHWSFWVIGAVALIFNVMGIINFISQMNADMVAAMPEPYRVIIEARPPWATGAFAIAVFSGVLGCLLLLLRKSAAYYLFIVSLLAAIVATIQFNVAAHFSLLDTLIGSLMQLVVTVFLIWYTKWIERKGWK
jgi:hypothetical protein